MEEFRTDDGPIGGELERLAKTVSIAIAILRSVPMTVRMVVATDLVD